MEQIILRFFEGIRNPFLTALFGAFSLLGEATVVGGIAILIFWLAPKRAGEKIVMTALTSFPLNAFVKFTVKRPRPFVKDGIHYLEPPFADALDPEASFPSGHTQSSSSLLFAAACEGKGAAAWVIAGVAVLLVMLARLYFGAHYPTDVLMGLLLGIAVVLLWELVFRFAHAWRYFVLLSLAALSLVPLLFSPAHDYVQAAGLLTGAAVALGAGELCLPELSDAPFPRRLWRIPVGVSLVAAVFAFCMLFPEGDGFSLLKWFLIAFTAGFPAKYAFQRLEI